jgi:hypothetical protein
MRHMLLPELRRARLVVTSLALALSFSGAACDPAEDPAVWKEGPAFLTVAPSADQPSTDERGTSIFVQARGGSFVSIVTYGGKHRYTTLPNEMTVSCAVLPGPEPMYLFVKPDGRECTLEARLYTACDPGMDSSVSLGICGGQDTYVASAALTIARPNLDGSPSLLGDAVTEPDAKAKDAALEADR